MWRLVGNTYCMSNILGNKYFITHPSRPHMYIVWNLHVSSSFHIAFLNKYTAQWYYSFLKCFISFDCFPKCNLGLQKHEHTPRVNSHPKLIQGSYSTSLRPLQSSFWTMLKRMLCYWKVVFATTERVLMTVVMCELFTSCSLLEYFWCKLHNMWIGNNCTRWCY